MEPNSRPLIPAKSPEVRKVLPADFPELFAWLVPVLKDTWPDLSDNGVVHWLVQASADRMSWFIRTKQAVGLFLATDHVLAPTPSVAEIFVRTREASTEEVCVIYHSAAVWALSIRATRFSFNQDAGNAPMTWVVPAVERAFPGAKARKQTIYTITKAG